LRHHQAGQLRESERLYQRILAQQPHHADALHLLGVVAYQSGRAGVAVRLIRRAIDHRSDIAAYHANLGLALAALGKLDEALTCYQAALDLQPLYPEVLCNLGAALGRLGRPAEAVAAYQRSLSLRPEQPETHYNLATLLAAQNQLSDAVRCYREAIRLKPDYPEAVNNLGISLVNLGRVEDAVACYRQALALRAGDPAVQNNLGAALAELGELKEAADCYRIVLSLDPTHAEAHYNLARTLLAKGDMAAGWPAFEWRWRTQQLRAATRPFVQPQWRGEAGQAQTLLIHAEQGFGDTLQFCRFAPLAATRGLRVILEVPEPLVRLMRSLPGVAQVVARGERLPRFDLHCPMMSLPLAFGTTLQTIPTAVPYLCADPAQTADWRARIASSGAGLLRVGLVWAGAPRPDSASLSAIDRRRSLAPEMLAPLFAVSGLQFFSLQKAGPRPPPHFPLVDFMAEMHDFADTSALVAQLDLVISVDTAVAHLAAALGKPVWLLSRFDACWRWHADRGDSPQLDNPRDCPWYPQLRVYRQPAPGDWLRVVGQVAEDLHQISSLSPPTLCQIKV
jgi:tetratricopeptide (TPR) repeat protein